jgi:sugar (pentulose or hexulose) kinase
MTDGCAAQIAAGALGTGDWNSVLGTTLVLKGCSQERIDDPEQGVYSHRSPDGGWLPGGASSSGAGVLTAAFEGRDLDELGRRAAAHERTRVLAYPLVSRGERFPFVAPDAEAFMLGTPAGDGEHAAALMQGLALVERLCFERLGRLGAQAGGTLSLTGGATRNRRWCQLRADALGRPVRLPEQAESAFGMAILAAASVAGERVADAARRMSRTRAVLEPRAAMHAHLDEQHARLLAELERRGWLGGGGGAGAG